jgi:hypothetical protein
MELVRGPLVTLFAPGVGTIVVTTRRLITLRTWTGRAVAVDPVRAELGPALSW